jgi:tetratricopeptide (TPR) repeat protein
MVLGMSGGDDTAALKRWLELEPTSLDANGQYLWQLWAGQGRHAEAMAVFDTMRALEPDAVQMLGLISNLLRIEGRLDEVLAWRFGTFVDQMPEGPWRLARLTTDYMNLGLYEQARQIGLQTWETRRASATHFMPLLWVRSGEPERAAEAMEWLTQTLEAASGSPAARMNLAAFYMATLRDFERAQELYSEVLAEQDLQELCEQDEDCVISNALSLAQIERTLGRDPEAGTWLRVAEDLAGQMPLDENTDRMWPQLRIAQGRHEQAIDLLRQSVFEWSSDGDLVYPIYFLEADAMFDPLRELPGFQRLLDDYQAHLEPMRQRILEARESGGWEALRNSTYQWVRDESG